MKIAIVHDWLTNLSGAERVLLELHNIFPEAPIYTLFYNKKFASRYLPNAEIRPSFLQRIPGIIRNRKYFLFLMPIAIESFDLSDFDLVISSSVIFSKGLILKPKTRHICYCYSPTRQLWDLNSITDYGLRIDNPQLAIRNTLIETLKHFLRIWDRQASDRVDQFVAISQYVASRISKYYRREAKVIYPPVNNFQFSISNFQSNSNDLMFKNLGDYFLIVSRLYKHKNIDIAIETFSKLNLPLVIIGDGPERKKLLRYCAIVLRAKNIKFLGFISDRELPYYYQNCKAFIMPQEEDFGITPIEAMLFGKPVLALRKGGAIETVIEGQTGEFFDDPIPEALADGIRRLNENYTNYNSEFIKTYAQKFSAERFRKEILNLIKPD